MSLFNFLTKTYGYNKPILANEVEYENHPKQQIYKELSELCKAKKIIRLERYVFILYIIFGNGTHILNEKCFFKTEHFAEGDGVHLP